MCIIAGNHRPIIVIPIHHTGQYVLNILTKIDIIHLAALIQRVHEGYILCCFMAARVQPIAPTHSNVAENGFNGIIQMLV